MGATQDAHSAESAEMRGEYRIGAAIHAALDRVEASIALRDAHDNWMRLHTCRHCDAVDEFDPFATSQVSPATQLCRDWFSCEARAGRKRGRNDDA